MLVGRKLPRGRNLGSIAMGIDATVVASNPPHAFPGVSSTPQPGSRPDLRSLLDQAITQMAGLEPALQTERARLSSLRERLEQGRLNLAVLGQFKRGKSTLLNALLGDSVLPTSVVPLTAVPTFIRAGTFLKARVFFENSRPPEEYAAPSTTGLCEFLTRFVTETGNPKNLLGVSHVEVQHPAPILQKGVVLIDTPGIGSTFRHNTEATLNFLPHCDAALFLVSADPPITETEVEFLRQVRVKVPRLFFLLNKADYLSVEERQEALRFFKKVLEEQAGMAPGPTIFCVSARLGLRSRSEHKPELWAVSGLADIEKHLVDFLAHEKTTALAEALSQKAAAVLGDTVMRLRLNIRSLQMPIEELQKRLDIFDRKLVEIEQERVVAADLLTGNLKRMHEFLEKYSETLRAKSREYLGGVVQEALVRNEDRILNENALQEALADVIPGFFERETGVATALFEKKIAETLRPHQERADRLIQSVRKTAAELFDIPYTAPESAEAFEMVDQPYWVTHKWDTAIRPMSEGLIDRLTTAQNRRRRILQRVRAQLGDLVIQNVENLRWAAFQSLDRTFMQFQNELDQRLAETVAATHGAIQAALKKRQEQSESAAGEVRRLESAVTALTEVGAELDRRCTGEFR